MGHEAIVSWGEFYSNGIFLHSVQQSDVACVQSCGRISSVNVRSRFAVHPDVEALAQSRFRCPCCGYRTLKAPDALGLCPVCWWEDDGQEDEDAAEVRQTVNGSLSLNEARTHYAHCGASHPRFLPFVRKPQAAEQ